MLTTCTHPTLKPHPKFQAGRGITAYRGFSGPTDRHSPSVTTPLGDSTLLPNNQIRSPRMRLGHCCPWTVWSGPGRWQKSCPGKPSQPLLIDAESWALAHPKQNPPRHSPQTCIKGWRERGPQHLGRPKAGLLTWLRKGKAGEKWRQEATASFSPELNRTVPLGGGS